MIADAKDLPSVDRATRRVLMLPASRHFPLVERASEESVSFEGSFAEHDPSCLALSPIGSER